MTAAQTSTLYQLKYEGGFVPGSETERTPGFSVLVRRLEPVGYAAGLMRGRQGHPDMGTRR